MTAVVQDKLIGIVSGIVLLILFALELLVLGLQIEGCANIAVASFFTAAVAAALKFLRAV